MMGEVILHGEKRTVLPVSSASFDCELLVTMDGRPAWPASGVEFHEALASFVRAGGGELEACQAAPATLTRGDAALVVGLCSEVAEAGRLYAHLTGRTYRTLSEPAEWLSMKTEIIVALLEHVTEDLLLALSEHRAPISPGLVVGVDRDDLIRQVLQRSAAVTVHWTTKTPRLYVDPRAPVRIQPSALGPLVGRHADPTLMRTLLSAGAGVLCVTTDSDGLDAYLGDTFACPLDGDIGDARGSRAPRCAQTRCCPRFNEPVPEAFAAGRLIGAGELAANILVWNTPFGFPVAGSPLAQRWTMWRGLHRNMKIGAIVTTWSSSHACADVARLITMLNDGTPIGEAVACHNRSPEVMASGGQLVLFGDPAMRSPSFRAGASERISLATVGDSFLESESDSASIELGGEHVEVVWQLPDPSSELAELAVLRHMVGSGHRWVDSFDGRRELTGPTIELALMKQASAFEASAIALEYERALLRRQVPERLMRALHDSVLSAIMQHGRVESWAPIAHSQTLEFVTCHVCQGRASRVLYALSVAGCHDRKVTTCPRCHVTEDAPESSTLRLVVSRQGEMVLEGELPNVAWTARLMLWHQAYLDSKIYEWPTSHTGEPSRRWTIPRPHCEAVTQVSVYFMIGTTFIMLNQAVAIGPD